MKEVKAIVKPFVLERVLTALNGIAGLTSVTVSEARGIDLKRGQLDEQPKSKLEIMVADDLTHEVVCTIQRHAQTGHAGDGRIYVIPVETTVKVRTGEREPPGTT